MTDEEVIQQFTPIIMKYAHKFSRDPRSLSDYEDLVAVGCMAAVEALRTFDPKKAKLTTHAFRLIQNRMQIERDGMRNIGRAHNSLLMRLAKAYRELGKDATDAQIIKWSKKIHKHQSTRLTKVNLPEIKKLAEYRYGSLDRLMALPDGIGEKYIPEDPIDLDELVQQKQEKKILRQAMEDCLTEKELYILTERLKEKNLEEIAVHYNVTRERIRQIESKAMRKLQGYFKRHKGIEFEFKGGLF